MITPEQGVDAINAGFGRHPHTRALHAKGSVCSGAFTASPTYSVSIDRRLAD